MYMYLVFITWEVIWYHWPMLTIPLSSTEIHLKIFLPLQNLFAVPNHPTFELLNFTCKHPVLLPY